MEFLCIGAVLGLLVGILGTSVAAGVTALLVTTFLSWVILPVLLPNFVGIWFIATVGLGFGLGVKFLVARDNDRGLRGPGVLIGATCALIAVFLVYGFLSTSAIFHASDYAALLGEVRTVKLDEAIQRVSTNGQEHETTVIDQSDIPLVPESVALKRAQDLIGVDPNLGGTFVLGKPQRTRKNGRLVYAFMLEWSGFTRWLSGGPSPGYVWVDANDERQGEFVRSVAGKPIAIRCNDTAYFGDEMELRLWANGHQMVGLTDYSLEIDDRGAPMYVVTRYDHRIGFGGDDVTGVVVFDPQTCEGRDYGLSDIPAWVNRVVPASMVADQVADWGAYRGGWNNQAFGSHAGVLVPVQASGSSEDDSDGDEANGVVLLPTAHGGATAFYVGVTTTGNPNGTVGFMTVDSRTKRATFFEQSGATEQAAVANVLSHETRRDYRASWPILLNVNGTATYMSVMLTPSGTFGGIGMTPVDDRNFVVLAPDLQTAVREIRQGVVRAGSRNGVGPGGSAGTFASRIVRIGSFSANGRGTYYFMLADRPGVVFNADPAAVGAPLVLAQVGDLVRGQANDDGSGGFTVATMVDDALLPSAVK